jgi:ferrous iron transport protein B
MAHHEQRDHHHAHHEQRNNERKRRRHERRDSHAHHEHHEHHNHYEHHDHHDPHVRRDRRQRKRYALIGNPNSGKTTLFNELTGASQHVGNWPGVTVERKTGQLRSVFGRNVEITDLPGIYSLNPHSTEERISRNFIIDDKPDVVINIVEATNIERNLFLTCQIAELGVPMVIALNMMDEAAREGDAIDILRLSKLLGIPVVPITAIAGEGVVELIDALSELERLLAFVDREAQQLPHEGEDEHGHGYHDTEDPHEHISDHHSDDEGRTNALIASGRYHNHYKGPTVIQSLDGEALSVEDETSNAERRYKFISGVIDATVKKGRGAAEHTTSDKIDRFLTNPIIGIPIFLAIMWLMFHLVFTEDLFGLGFPGPGVWLQGLTEQLLGAFSTALAAVLPEGFWFEGLLFDGIIGGVGAVVSFLPQILILFFFLTLLEDIGYMSRTAFVMDRILRKFGLSGKSFLPMLMGFGCSVPAIMACRTLENENDRKLTLFLVPFMSCGARAPIYLVFAGAFFAANADLIVFGLYFTGIIVAILTGIILKKFVFRGETTPLLIELPHYRAPRIKSLGLALYKSMKDYLMRAGTIIFAMSVVVWFLSSYDFSLQAVEIDASILAAIGHSIAPVFTPLGFGFWVAAVAILTGFFAKEAVIGTLGVLCGIGEESALEGGGLSAAALAAVGFSPLSAFSFMVFCLLYLPCMAAFATLKREYNSWIWTLCQAAYSVGIAWIFSFAAYKIGGIFISTV